MIQGALDLVKDDPREREENELPFSEKIQRIKGEGKMETLWITPRLAGAANLAQLVAFPSHSMLIRRKLSTVVPECMRAFAKRTAEKLIEYLTSVLFCLF